MIINDTNFEENKKPNASQITHGLAQLGGGSKKDGGSGMMGGMENIFKKGLELRDENALENKKQSDGLLGNSEKK